jgi:hypothetical protein
LLPGVAEAAAIYSIARGVTTFAAASAVSGVWKQLSGLQLGLVTDLALVQWSLSPLSARVGNYAELSA